MRDAEQLLSDGLSVIDQGFSTPAISGRRRTFAEAMIPLFSGGHDSLCACHVASMHQRFRGIVNHIDTGIGSKRTREHVEAVCELFGWKLNVYRSPYTYERFVRERGFPGPGMHQWAYNRLKERCVRMMVFRMRAALITGCRKHESTRRMGSVEAVKVGEPGLLGGRKVVKNRNRFWVAPCHDWTSDEQAAYIDAFDLPNNPVKLALGMSGECFCGAFASPGEIERIRRHCPDVADEIDRLSAIAVASGKHSVWGTRPAGSCKGKAVARSGPLCSTCDLKASAAGIVFDKE